MSGMIDSPTCVMREGLDGCNQESAFNSGPGATSCSMNASRCRRGFGALGYHSRLGPLGEERKIPMVWPAILLILLLVPGGSEADIICDEFTARSIAAGDLPEDRWSLRGFFVDPDRQTRLFLRVAPHECFLQHEAGPLSVAGSRWTGFAGLCRDPVSGRDLAILSANPGGNSGISYLEYWSVQPDTERATREYTQMTSSELEFNPLPELSDADGQCLWRQQKRARDVFKDAIAALHVGTELEEKALALEVSATLTLPTRPLPAAVVRHWLHELHTHAPALVTFETARYSDESHPQPWRILQILGRKTCAAPGVVLLQDTRSRQWRSIYDVHSGCSKSLNFPLREMRITGDTLLAEFCTNCGWWGQYGKFTLDLPTNRVTRLEDDELPWGENIPITDPLSFVNLDRSATPRAADAAQ